MRTSPRRPRTPLRWALALALLLIAPIAARAAEPKCPLELAACLGQYDIMRERPWLGVEVYGDSLERFIIIKVVPGSPAQRAGIRPGDVLQTIGGKPPKEWFAGKAGWIDGETGEIAVWRGGRTKSLRLPYEAIPEELLARMVGVHMLEGHLAYMHEPRSGSH